MPFGPPESIESVAAINAKRRAWYADAVTAMVERGAAKNIEEARKRHEAWAAYQDSLSSAMEEIDYLLLALDGKSAYCV